jgi:hypothetical protein
LDAKEFVVLSLWQTSWSIPTSVNAGMQTTHTLIDLEAEQTHHFAVTAQMKTVEGHVPTQIR